MKRQQKIRNGVVVTPAAETREFVDGSFSPKSVLLAQRLEGSVFCSSCLQRTRAYEAWSFANVTGSFCVKCAPAAEATAIAIAPFTFSLAQIAHELFRIIPRVLRQPSTYYCGQRPANALELALDAARTFIRDAAETDRERVVEQLHSSLESLEWAALSQDELDVNVDPLVVGAERVIAYMRAQLKQS